MEYRKVVTGILLPLMLAGCAAKAWHHPHIESSRDHERQLVIDNGYCKQAALGSVPMPDVPIEAVSMGTSAYQTQGSIRTFGNNGMTTSYYSGTTTPMASPMQNFSQGFAQGAALGAVISARRAQQEIYDSCMYRLGWEEGDRPSNASNAGSVDAVNVNQTETGSAPNEATTFRCSSHRNLAGRIDDVWREGMPREVAVERVKTTASTMKISFESTAKLLWTVGARYAIVEDISKETFQDFITDMCTEGWQDIPVPEGGWQNIPFTAGTRP